MAIKYNKDIITFDEINSTFDFNNSGKLKVK